MEDMFWLCPTCGRLNSGDVAACGNCRQQMPRGTPLLAADDPEIAAWMDEPAAGAPVGNVRYNPSIIIQFANGLYSMATLWLVVYSVAGVAGGLAAGVSFGGGVGLIIGGGVGLILGYLLGDARANDYRLRAQLALCQVQIEENTRHDGT